MGSRAFASNVRLATASWDGVMERTVSAVWLPRGFACDHATAGLVAIADQQSRKAMIFFMMNSSLSLGGLRLRAWAAVASPGASFASGRANAIRAARSGRSEGIRRNGSIQLPV
jgi:hypothetical protein